MAQEIVNNTLFEKKHHYMFIMKEVEILKRQMEREALDNEISRSRLDEIRTVWNLTFIGLLREGLEYQYIKNANNPNKDMIRLTIDNINYDCYVLIIEKALKDEYESVMKLKDRGIEYPKSFSESTKANTSTITLAKDDKENNSEAIKVPASSKEISSAFIEDEADFTLKKEDVVYPEPHEEFIKYEGTWVYDLHHIEVLQPGSINGDKFDIYVAPYRIEKDNSKTKIMVAIKNSKNDIETFYSDETSSVVVRFDEHEFIIRGSFANYEFSSYILTGGITATMNCSINDDTEEFRCNDVNRVNYGHIFYTAKDNEGNEAGKIHIFPLTSKNNKYSVADVAIFVEDINGVKSSTYSYHQKHVGVSLDGEIFKIITYWQENFLTSDVIANVD